MLHYPLWLFTMICLVDFAKFKEKVTMADMG